MKQVYLIIVFVLFSASTFFGQVAVNQDFSAPDNSAMLDVKSVTKGFLPPRLTTAQRNAIVSPAAGLMLYNTEEKILNVFNGTSWGSLTPLVPGQPFTDPRDGKVYKTVQIGTQLWMAQNLNIGTKISSCFLCYQTNNGLFEKYCLNDDEGKCTIYGGLYEWNEMMNYTASSSSNPSGRQGICPPDWHLPSDAEWCQMETYIDATVTCATLGPQGTDVGAKMMETGWAHWVQTNTIATNTSGFTALPGGYRSIQGGTYWVGFEADFWTSTDDPLSIPIPNFPFVRQLTATIPTVVRGNSPKSSGMSIRCIKD